MGNPSPATSASNQCSRGQARLVRNQPVSAAIAARYRMPKRQLPMLSAARSHCVAPAKNSQNVAHTNSSPGSLRIGRDLSGCLALTISVDILDACRSCLIDQLLELSPGAAGNDPIAEVALWCEPWQLDDLYAGRFPLQRGSNGMRVLASWLIVVGDQDDRAAGQKRNVIGAPLAGAHRRGGRDEPKLASCLNILLAFDQEDRLRDVG